MSIYSNKVGPLFLFAHSIGNMHILQAKKINIVRSHMCEESINSVNLFS